MGNIEERAGDLKNIAFNVKNSADQLRKEAARRNRRIMIITVLVALALLAYIILPLVAETAAGSSDGAEDEEVEAADGE